MRGGALPLLAWATLLVVLLAINWIWTGDAIQIGTFAFAALAIYAGAALLGQSNREALRPGAPEPRPEPETVPQASIGAVIAGLSVAAILFGLTFGRFLIFFGAGMLVVALGRLALELRSQRQSREQITNKRPQ
jgi:Na+/H+-translocating membrane pyrophosphatase